MTDEADDAAEGEVSSELSSTYTPFTGSSSSGTASLYDWHGYKTTYPATNENFRAYASGTTIECASAKTRRSHVDVTAGCLTASNVGGSVRGKITSTSDGAFRMVALPFTGSETRPLKWTDQRNEYRFYYQGTSGPGVDKGFKAFARYRTEDDLYVAAWRADGIVQLKKKQGGKYTLLAQVTKSRPSTGAWHRLRLDAIGTRLDVYIDGTRVISKTDTTFAWGTAGIRTDGMNGALIDEWTVR